MTYPVLAGISVMVVITALYLKIAASATGPKHRVRSRRR